MNNPFIGLLLVIRGIAWVGRRIERKRRQLFARFMHKVWEARNLKDI